MSIKKVKVQTKTVGKAIELFLKKEFQIREANRAIKLLKKEAVILHDKAVETLKKVDLPRGDYPELGYAKIVEEDMGNVNDWNKFYKYIVKNDAWDLLQKRVGQTAYRERKEAGVKIPGTDNFVKESLKAVFNRGI